MAINIDDPETEQIVRELAALTGVSLTETVHVAVEAQLAIKKADRAEEIALRKAANERIFAELHALPVLDSRPWREIRDDLWDGL